MCLGELSQTIFHISSRTRASSARQLVTSSNINKIKIPTDLEDVIPASRKRKRNPPRKPTKYTVKKDEKDLKEEAQENKKNKDVFAGEKIKEEVKEEDQKSSLVKKRKERKPARRVKNQETGSMEIQPPSNWEEMYNTMKEMRINGISQNAAVDTMGCERIAEANASPRDVRLHTLISLMLSSQTKDTINAAAMNRLYRELPPHKEGAQGGLTLENLLAVDAALLNELIWAVGFHNNKTKYIKATAEILRDKWNSDIPDNIEGLVSLPGVGPKMAYLCLSSAWGRTEGIGVDVHVHRITNLWGWHKTKTPEETRLALQAWLPKEFWHEINWLLVGFGQTTCLPIGRKCGDCDLALKGLCKSVDPSKRLPPTFLPKSEKNIKNIKVDPEFKQEE
ncbi:Endonuclease III-like protein [Erysiphe neolycopersici]|uniref:Endonuclease III homolog n=1 Tax=Erysiphe neolycopersici TaxID=212602 RepID=A0A420HJQ1_9PEZI|nr:Endonuclease III-like protein [Erysiphe neolycopersici]